MEIKIKKWDVYWKMTLTWNSERRISGKGKSTYVECVCVCWTKKWVCLNSLRQGDTKWCGCQNRIHWMTNSRIFHIYNKIKDRCTNPNLREWKYYWGRWIKLERETFSDFYRDMWESYKEHCKEFWESQTTIDRIDNNWNYCKQNCKWATRFEQRINQTRHKRIIYNGETFLTLKSLCKKYWIWESTVRWRLSYWWTLEDAISTPVHSYNRRM